MEDPTLPAWLNPDGKGKPEGDVSTAEADRRRETLVLDGELLAVQDGPDELLGTVISDDKSPTFEEVRFRLAAHVTVSPGEFVAIEGRNREGHLLSWVLGRVLDVHEVNPHEDPQSATVRDVLPFDSTYATEGESTVIFRVVRCEPVEELPIVTRGIGDPTEIRTLPRAGDAVRRPQADMVTTAMGFPPNPDDGLHMGSLHSDGSIPVTIDPGAVQRHVLIVGGIGSGKSYTRGVLGEELHRLGVPQVNIDVNGEMIDAAEQLGGVNVRPGEGFTLPVSALTREDLIEAIAGVQKGTQYEILIGYSFDVLQRKLRADGIGFTVADLVEEIGVQAPELDMAKPQTLRPAQLRAKALERRPYLGPQFSWVNVLKPGAFVNLDCRGVLLNDLRIIAAAVARDLQNLARQRAIPFTVLSIDEFHLVSPNDDKLVSTQVLREIARIGRHYRLGLILTTQSPSDVDRAVLKRLLTRFVHTIEPDQLDSLRGIFADAPAEMVRSLPKLPRGTCVLTGVAETVRHATVVDIRSRVTHHGGATPNVFADLRERGWPGKKRLSDIVPDDSLKDGGAADAR
ncbi:ATP-binding protein [Micromonospora sp. HM134]|uniref:ATP-binding protein n=1 Tax=Micromonospora sp. HM134 TaxID=2583243 RepID=UPI001198BDB3|nr:ATP-binding protein [Micromonospora sp. HM134]QDY11129.1 ATP-binding protein [Micromonospora sp. HM134]